MTAQVVTTKYVNPSCLNLSRESLDNLNNSQITWGGARFTLVLPSDILNEIEDDSDRATLNRLMEAHGETILVNLEG